MTAARRATGSLAPDDPVTVLAGVGEVLAGRLARLGIHRLFDLLLHLPSGYEDRCRTLRIGALGVGDTVTVQGEVLLARLQASGRGMTLVARVADGTGQLQLRFFHPHARLRHLLARGSRVRCHGEVRDAGGGLVEMIHPDIQADNGQPATAAPVLTPVYPLTAGLHQMTLRSLVARALESLGGAGLLTELVPEALRSRLALPTLCDALCLVHRPPLDASVPDLLEGRHPARRRLALEEVLAHQLSMRRLGEARREQRAPVLRVAPGGLRASWLASLPFELTGAQLRVIGEIDDDLGGGRPMQRLLQGDVGSGKTAVAAAAILAAVEAGHQAAIMAPTELLADQHQRSLGAWLEPLGVRIRCLKGRMPRALRREALQEVASGTASVVVGTHALFQDEVRFARLGLLVIDEQHRFGVHQRLALREKGRGGARYPHQLTMTATPIPRTLMMTAYADLDCSIIDELPPGREPVVTVVVPETRRAEVIARVREACTEGRQAYWVCTLIDESEAVQCQAATETAAALREALSGLEVGLIHGRMSPDEKDRVMAAFARGETDLLVATTVIEVGVDVPRASLMIVENAERLGLAQLHQLRGRVGRGGGRSACVLMYHGPLSERGHARLAVLRDTADGFRIAARDLELRGPGELLGIRQAGDMGLRVADLHRDADLVMAAAEVAGRMWHEDSEGAAAMVRRWLEKKTQYGAV